jgi:hypothetical protein
MSAKSPGTGKPRSWDDLQRRVLEEGYLTLSDLERRRRATRHLQSAIWVAPLVLLGVAADILADGKTQWPVVVAAALCLYACIAAYQLGRRWNRRWDALIPKRTSARRDARGRE